MDESPLTVRLVVGAGTHAGVTAEIREGIYMIGRDRECQIRPKSQSVSDRHCLVQHQSGTVRVFDLDSDEGTFVNEDRLRPKTWRLLDHGDRLRCGKYWFDVAIYRREVEVDDVEPDEVEESDTGDDLLAMPVGAVHAVSMTIDEDIIDPFGEEHFATDVPLGKPDAVPTTSKSAVALPQKDTAKSRASRLPKPKIQHHRASRGGGFSLALAGPDSLKIILLGLLSVSVVGYLGWTIYGIQKGPEPKILRGVD